MTRLIIGAKCQIVPAKAVVDDDQHLTVQSTCKHEFHKELQREIIFKELVPGLLFVIVSKYEKVCKVG